MHWGDLSKNSNVKRMNHPSTSIYPPIGEGVSTNHESSNRIELSQLGEDLFDI